MIPHRSASNPTSLRRICIALAAMLMIFVLPPVWAADATKTYFDSTDIGVPPGYTGNAAAPSPLNGVDQMVVDCYNGFQGQKYLYGGGVFTLLPFDYGSYAFVNDVGHTSGSINGQTVYFDGVSHNIKLSYGDSQNWVSTVANGMNNLDEVVGVYTDTDGNTGAFLYDGATHDISKLLPGRPEFVPVAINDHEVILGKLNVGGNTHAAVWDRHNGLRDLGTFGFSYSIPTAINNKGEVVGYSNRTDGVVHAFLYTPGATDGVSGNIQMKDLGSLDSGSSYATSINDYDQVVGVCSSGDFYWSKVSGIYNLNGYINAPPSPPLLRDTPRISNSGSITDSAPDPASGYSRIYLLTPTFVQQTHVDRVSFQTHDQNLWASGSESVFDYYHQIGFPSGSTVNNNGWNVGPVVSNFFTPHIGGWHIDLGFFGIDIPGISLGEFGYSAALHTEGAAYLAVKARAESGSVSVNYPISVAMTYPGRESLFVGQKFSISSSYSADSAAGFSTKPPYASASLYTHLESKNTAGFKAKAFGASIFDFELVPTDLQEIKPQEKVIFDTGNLLAGTNYADFVFPSNDRPYITGYYKVPQIGMTGALDTLHPGQIAGTAEDTALSATGHVTDVFANILGIPLSARFATDDGSLWGGYNLLDLRATADVRLHQDLRFVPKPRIHFDLDQPVKWIDAAKTTHTGQTTIDFDAGQTIQIYMPGAVTDPKSVRLGITPTFSLPNTFTNTTSAVIGADAGLVPLELYGGASLFGWNLGSFDAVPFSWTFGANKTIPIVNTSFTLDGFPQKRASVFNILGSVHPAPNLKKVSPGALTLYIAKATMATGTDYANFRRFLSAAPTVLTVSGTHFLSPADGGTKCYLEIYGNRLPLPTTYLNSSTLQVAVPNKFRLLPGVGRLTCVTDPALGTSNSLDMQIQYPTPQIRTVGPNVWASDPDFRDVPLTVDDQGVVVSGVPGDSFVKRADYFRVLQNQYWTRSYPEPMNRFFPGWDFSEDAVLPAIIWDNQSLMSFHEPIASGLLWSVLPVAYYDRPRQVAVQVRVPGPGGGVSNTVTSYVGALQPVVTRVQPAGAQPGDATVRLTVSGPDSNSIPGDSSHKGGNFNGTSVVLWNGAPLSTVFVSSSELQADVPATLLAAGGTASVAVENPGATDTPNVGSDTSSAISFPVVNPVPAIGRGTLADNSVVDTINPRVIIANDPNFLPYYLNTDENDKQLTDGYDLNVVGTGFVKSSRVLWNGKALQTRYTSAGSLDAIVPAYNVAHPGSAKITVVNPVPGGGTSGSATLTILTASPTIPSGTPANQQAAADNLTLKLTKLDPSAMVDMNSPAFNLTLEGQGFCADSKVTWNGTARTPNLVSFNILTLPLSASDMATSGKVTLTVVNPSTGGKGGGASNPLTLTISPAFLKGVTLAHSTVVGTLTLSGSVTLAAAPVADAKIFLFSSSANASVPASVTVKAGQTSVAFTITTKAVPAETGVTITAVKPLDVNHPQDGPSQSATFRIVEPTLKTLVPSSSTVQIGKTVTATVTLEAATGMDQNVSFVGSANVSISPSTATIKAGGTKASFVVTGKTKGTVTVSATLPGQGSVPGKQLSFQLTVTP